ncbi:unnamed protein product [Bursaphelenchus okinawaensis]|uniref:Uncharacterized protein n=1 Tax=Bursaphelenchus okinawaensis TaxID=465554 RepID=A0A811L5Q3_9BILA|nr:unnamed protein product [Bursaphelenchus okinawaensis]CAG9117200.1 unnamed protein product [Bursaphelenchus okinawaensis]
MSFLSPSFSSHQREDEKTHYENVKVSRGKTHRRKLHKPRHASVNLLAETAIKSAKPPKQATKLTKLQRQNIVESKRMMYDKFYAGVQHPDEMKKILKCTQFQVYYRKANFRWDIPAELPMYLAYKDSNERMYHFPIIHGPDGLGGLQWSVQTPFDMPNATCSSLSKLLEHYGIYSFVVPDTGDIEVFPIWQMNDHTSKSTDTSASIY